MSNTKSKESHPLPSLDAIDARQLMHEALEASQEEDARKDAHRDQVALRFSGLILAQIHKAAEKGKTQVEFFIKDRHLPNEHRQQVIQRITHLLDVRGFNVLSYWQYSVFGSGSILQIEW
ncbi:MAG: hypothetical protein U0905_13205 [Pirellulales bacterium]